MILMTTLLFSLSTFASSGLGSLGSISSLKLDSKNLEKNKKNEVSRELANKEESKQSYFERLREKFNKKQ